MDNENKQEITEEIEKIEEESYTALESLHEEGNEKNEEVINDAKSKFEKVFDDAKAKVDEMKDSKEVQDFIAKVKEQAEKIFNTTKAKAVDLSENEQFKKAILSGKEFIVSSSAFIVEQVGVGVEKIKGNEKIMDALKQAEGKIDEVVQSDKFKETVSKAEEITVKVSDKVVEGLSKLFKNKED